MIIPNLMVEDMHASLAFYRDVLGFELRMALDADKQMHTNPTGKPIVFATLAWGEAELMLQTVESLADDLPVFTPQSKPAASGTIYVRGFHPDELSNLDLTDITVKGPFQQWYGMKELYLRDPDGHIICLGAAEGAPPT